MARNFKIKPSGSFTNVNSILIEHCSSIQIKSLVEIFGWTPVNCSVIPLSNGFVYVSYTLMRDGFRLVMNSSPICRQSIVKYPIYHPDYELS